MPPKSDLLAELRQPPTAPLPRPPELIRSYTTPYTPSPPPPESPIAPSATKPVLRKRHSTYINRPERSTSPIPELPPHRPPRNPARTSTMISEAAPVRPQKPKSKSRPSTATSTRDEVTPWEFQPGPESSSRMRSAAPSVKSKASSTGLATGPIEDVAPWELYPVGTVPVSLPSPRAIPSPILTGQSHPGPPPPPKSLHPSKATGLVEDVTPWELQPEPQSAASPTSARGDTPSLPPVFSPSRSHPASLLSEPTSGSYRLSTATGPAEEVTPWELEATPEDVVNEKDAVNEPSSSTSHRNSLTMTKAQLEEVMPWELYPAPPLPVINGGSTTLKNGVHSTRVSTSSTKTLSDFALIRRRKSTGSRPSKSRSNSHPTPPKVQTRAPSSQSLVNGPGYEVATPKTAKSISSTAAVSSSDVYWHGIGTGSQTQSRDEGETTSSNTKFSTADRTILEELKRNLHARDAQFVMKGVGVHLVDGTISPGKKHHPYTTKDVPYPRSYEREVIDLDVWETLFCQDICESLTWHVFEEPPLRVLDIGCGSGTWILNCARQWRETQFVGLDIVPLHPDLQRVGSSDFASRITWVQANFLDGLPFPNDEFDFVHIKRIALGVPEDKWDALFDEISRVMKPGGALEMVEEDLFFPGKPVEHDDDETDMGSALSRSSSIASTNGRRDREVPAVIQEADGSEEGWLQPTSPNADSLSLATPTPMSAFPRPSSRPGSPKLQIITNLSKDGVPDDKNDIRSEVSTTPPGSPKGYITLIPPHSRSTARPLLYVKPQSGPYNHQFPSTSPPKPSSTFTNSAVSLLNSLTNHSHSDSDNQANLLFRRRRSSTNLASCNNSTYSGHAGHGPHHTPDSQIPETPKIPPFLLRTPAKAPNNPRDHSLLEYIYNETLSSRFINTSPIALLATYLEYHFKDTRTHPPLMFTFPPRPVKPSESDVEVDEGFSFPPKKPGPIRSVSSRKSLSPSNRSVLTDENGELTEENRWLNMQGLMTGSSPYVSLDGVRYGLYALSPAPKATFTTQKGIPPSLANMEPRIPNKTLNIDLRTLNLHLMLRAKEILACSETMWEWVRETQLSVHENPSVKRANGRAHSMDVPHAYRHGASDHRATVLEMSREDFNQLLLNFEMDMEDQASINHALRERLQWSVIESAPSQNRKIFNTACEKYEKWFRKESRASITSLMRPVPPFSNPTAPEASSSDLLKSTRKRSNSQTLLNRNGGPPSATSVSPLSLRLEPSVHFAKPSIRPELHPTQKLSRSMSVFVAWKPEAKGKS